MPERPHDNLLMVQCHGFGRYPRTRDGSGTRSPQLDALAAEGILFSRAHSTAPMCAPALGSINTGRYPHSHGLIRPVQQGWEYRGGVRTLAQVMSQAGWYSALFGMQHETALPPRLGFDEYDLSNAPCDSVVAQCADWLRTRVDATEPFLLTLGLFDTPGRGSLEGVDIATADDAVGGLLDVLSDTGLDATTWVVFVTDHGPALPHATSTLYDASTGIAPIVRPPRSARILPRIYDELFSGVDVMPTLLELFGIDVPTEVEGRSHAHNLTAAPEEAAAVHDHIFSSKTYSDSFDLVRAVRTKRYSYLENYAKQPTANVLLDIPHGSSVRIIVPDMGPAQPERELYDLLVDPHETRNLLAGRPVEGDLAVADGLADTLRGWRQNSGDVTPDENAGSQLLEQNAGQFWRMRNEGRRRGRRIRL